MFSDKLILLAFVVAAAAQSSSTARSSSTTGSATGTATSSPAAIPSIPPCVLSCIVPAAAQNNCSFADARCVCGSAQFQADATGCLNANCTPSEVEIARGLQQSQCGPIGVTPSGASATPRPVSTGTGGLTSLPTSTSPAGSPGSQTQPATSSAAATNAATAAAIDGTWAFAAAVLGAVVAL